MVVKVLFINFIFRYKLLTCTLSVLLIYISLHFIQFANRSIDSTDVSCSYSYPIDVVYTWVNGSDPKFLQNLQEYIQQNTTTKRDYTNQRFDDKYELKFSLRSLEKYAPWVRHVYIVTNGQIPYWLNLDYEKVSIVSHEQIFTDVYDLPTFSSPAIESHLHRIPGISENFIYFNDDVFLGSPIYLDDFLSPSKGFLIYLAWPLPMCAIDCPWMYVADGQCDKACYNLECQMDGGDCNSYEKGSLVGKESYVPKINSNELVETDFQGEEIIPQLDLTLLRRHSNYSSPKNKNTINYLNILDVLKNNSLRNSNAIRNRNKINLFSLPSEQKTTERQHSLNNAIVTQQFDNIRNRGHKSSLLKHLNNTTNLKDAIKTHNSNVIFQDKLKRKKRTIQKSFRKNRRKTDINALISFRNTTFFNKIKKKVKVDAYAASLQYVNRMFNLKYGYTTRQVPAHAPILINKNIMNNLQLEFPTEFFKTSRNRIRSEDDVQYAFTYYYYVIQEKYNLSIAEIFDRFDTDGSGTWSDREIRTLLTKLYDLPLSYAVVDHFEDVLLNCSKFERHLDVTTPEFERYIDSKLPTVSKQLVVNCPFLAEILKEHFGFKHKYKYEIIKNAQSKFVTFVMLNSNITEVVGHLDEIRRHTKKFICLNDNLDESKVSENELVRAVLYDFYLSLFPNPSKFELPVDFRNRFLYLDELNTWKLYHFKLKLCVYICIFILCYITYCNICKRRILYRIVNKICC